MLTFLDLVDDKMVLHILHKLPAVDAFVDQVKVLGHPPRFHHLHTELAAHLPVLDHGCRGDSGLLLGHHSGCDGFLGRRRASLRIVTTTFSLLKQFIGDFYRGILPFLCIPILPSLLSTQPVRHVHDIKIECRESFGAKTADYGRHREYLFN